MIKNYVISLPSAVDRRQHIVEQFGREQVAFEFFDAITPDQAMVRAQQFGLCFDAQQLTQGEFACFMSHVCLWQHMIQHNLSYIAIFEDDIHLGQGAQQYLTDTSWIDKSVNVIKLEFFSKRVLMKGQPISTMDGKRQLQQLLGANYGCAGYILSRAGAQSLLGFLSRYPSLIPIDHIVFRDYSRLGQYPVYQLNPALCIQDNMLNGGHQRFPSALVADRQVRMRRKPRSFIAKLQIESQRIWAQLVLALFATQIFFR